MGKKSQNPIVAARRAAPSLLLSAEARERRLSGVAVTDGRSSLRPAEGAAARKGARRGAGGHAEGAPAQARCGRQRAEGGAARRCPARPRDERGGGPGGVLRRHGGPGARPAASAPHEAAARSPPAAGAGWRPVRLAARALPGPQRRRGPGAGQLPRHDRAVRLHPARRLRVPQHPHARRRLQPRVLAGRVRAAPLSPPIAAPARCGRPGPGVAGRHPQEGAGAAFRPPRGRAVAELWERPALGASRGGARGAGWERAAPSGGTSGCGGVRERARRAGSARRVGLKREPRLLLSLRGPWGCCRWHSYGAVLLVLSRRRRRRCRLEWRWERRCGPKWSELGSEKRA